MREDLRNTRISREKSKETSKSNNKSKGKENMYQEKILKDLQLQENRRKIKELGTLEK